MRKQIAVWVCPTPECANYYGSSSQEGIDLTQEAVFARVEDRDERGDRIARGHRSDCPDCKQRKGVTVQRVKVLAVVDVPSADELAPIPA